MNREVSIANRHPRLRFRRAEVARVIHLLDAQFEKSPRSRGVVPLVRDRGESAVPPGELSIVFLTDQALAQIHANFMGDPTATDVITFAGDPANSLAGEVCVSADTAARFARTHRRKFAAELTLYLVHGWLHLAGYDDRQSAAKRRMRAAEKRAMTLVRAAGAVPEFQLS